MVATAKVLFNVLTHLKIYNVIGDKLGFLNVDEEIINNDLLNILDYERFVIEILETTVIDDIIIEKIRHLKHNGFMIAVDDF